MGGRLADLAREARRGFTLLELLVVVATVVILVSLLLPALSRAKEQARVTACASNMRSMYVALAAYSSNFGRFPTNFSTTPSDGTPTPLSYNWGDECEGRWSGGPPAGTPGSGPWTYTPNGTAETNVPAGIRKNSALARVFGLRYLTTIKGAMCNATNMFGSGTRWANNYDTPNYPIFMYNGPSTAGQNLRNNGGSSFLYALGRHSNNQASRGVRNAGLPVNAGGRQWNPADVAFLTCTSILLPSTSPPQFAEPHGGQPSYFGTGNGQFDFDTTSPYARNIVFGDGHALYWKSNPRRLP